MNQDQLHNRQGASFKTPPGEKGIKQKLKEYMGKVNVDLFGYEKMVNSNVKKFVTNIAQSEGVSPQEIFVRITKPDSMLRIFLHCKGRILKELTLKELVSFFLGSDSGQLLGVVPKVSLSISDFLKDHASKSGLEVNRLQVVISSGSDGTVIMSYNDRTLLEKITVKSLIQYFKK